MASDFTATSPYTVGRLLNLTILENIRDIESNGNTLSVQIEHLFLPFTKSETMRIRVLRQSPGPTLDIPEGAILKLYDRKWIDDRKFDDEPWSPKREQAALARWKAIASGELVDDFDELNPDDYTESHEEEQYRRICKVSLIQFFNQPNPNAFHRPRNDLKPNTKRIAVSRVYRVQPSRDVTEQS